MLLRRWASCACLLLRLSVLLPACASLRRLEYAFLVDGHVLLYVSDLLHYVCDRVRGANLSTLQCELHVHLRNRPELQNDPPSTV